MIERERERERELELSDPDATATREGTRPSRHHPATPRRRTPTIPLASASSTSLWFQILHAATRSGDSTTESLGSPPAISANSGDSGYRQSRLCCTPSPQSRSLSNCWCENHQFMTISVSTVGFWGLSLARLT
ncbi:hypothetical protein RchiOBHm_Chr6g0301061 [Rosa chinensis]|uniref:Uncharacterized protein n=1 Tax=Rosa chinensis TaxID=74649 RepID=A0A2P6PYL7_ROSCH|nr:hypothetical protein RchiOBHm_Chr6g0301061 [Rosa chinensis]